jgi:eukaryotic-like serine/threonine-protein kinase
MSKGHEAPSQEMIGPHYRIDRELGRGGMATVHLCTDTRTGRQVAVKVLRPEVSCMVTRERFFREVKLTSGLDHPRIPRVIESGTTEEAVYYVMDFVEGESLRDRLNKRSPLPLDEVVRLTTGIAAPVGHAHSHGILHRDIKPENIILDGDDVFVVDFGVARALMGAIGDRLTRTGVTLGTPAYMSPEQVIADRELDARSDIYSLGCVVYEMLAGTTPFRGATPHVMMASRFKTPPRPLLAIRPDIPAGVERVLLKAMAMKRDDRWASVDEFAVALSAAATAKA